MLSHKILHNEFDPPEELQDVIKCFWYEKRNPEKEQLSLEVLPDGYAEIIFYPQPRPRYGREVQDDRGE